ncbi:MAG: RagB/SusD family nutrient uptake outer membrane protein [Bacteroidetes bacterium]|nr:MAG: RagB/SusD family nutrient uptake outer membrane protein [Bacteroidota bacterium]
MRRFAHILTILFGSSLLFMACDSLNLEPKTELSGDIVWSDPALVEAYLNDVYSDAGYGFGDPMIAGLADEAKNTHGHGDAPMRLSNMSPTDLGLWQRDWEEVIRKFDWGVTYSRIRDLNTLIENVSASEALSEQTKQTMLGEAYFLRAFFYHELMRLHGGVPLVDQAFELGDDLSAYQTPRASFEETINFIVSDLDAAASRLTADGRRPGAATEGAALALKCRVLTHAASDLFAVNPSGMPETGYTGGDQQARWQAASNACKAVIDLGRYSLTPVSSAGEYHELFSKGNPGETIWARYFDPSGGENHDQALWVSPNGYNSWSGDTPLQEHVDAYEMTDGSEFSWDNPEHAADPYANRDPRFYANVLYNGAVWRPRPPGLDELDPVGVIQTGWFEMPDGNMRAGLDTREGPVQTWNGTKTGYNLRKFVDRDLLPDREQQFNPWPFLRYAEVLLNYAEAEAELGNASTAVDALNQVRARVGMPPVPIDGGPNRTLMDRIRQEREVELAFEEFRYFDIRRWMIAPEVHTNGHGIRVTGRLDPNGEPLMYAGEEYRYAYEYEVIQVDERIWNDRAYFLPIPQAEMDRNPNLVQNPGY